MSLKIFITVAAFSLWVLTTTAQTAAAKNSHHADKAAIRENVSQMEAGWNRKQAELFARPFAADADYVVINGRYFRGRDAIEKAHREIFATIFKNTTIQLAISQIRFLRPDVAVVHVTGHRDAPENERELISDARISLVMIKDKTDWQIAAFQITQIVNTSN